VIWINGFEHKNIIVFEMTTFGAEVIAFQDKKCTIKCLVDIDNKNNIYNKNRYNNLHFSNLKLQRFSGQINWRTRAINNKDLKEFLPLDDFDCSKLNESANRKFTPAEINKILYKIATQGRDRSFKDKFTFMKYVTLVIKNEMKKETFYVVQNVKESVKTETEYLKTEIRHDPVLKDIADTVEYVELIKADTERITQDKKSFSMLPISSIIQDMLSKITNDSIVKITLKSGVYLNDIQEYNILNAVKKVYKILGYDCNISKLEVVYRDRVAGRLAYFEQNDYSYL
jgi:hypothetical protein